MPVLLAVKSEDDAYIADYVSMIGKSTCRNQNGQFIANTLSPHWRTLWTTLELGEFPIELLGKLQASSNARPGRKERHMDREATPSGIYTTPYGRRKEGTGGWSFLLGPAVAGPTRY